jgi:hypothetical protein
MLTIIPDFPTDDATWREWFALDLNRAGSWATSARDLLDALEALTLSVQAAWRDLDAKKDAKAHSLHRTYLLLAGYAVENLLKGCVVLHQKWPDQTIEDKMPSLLISHDLLWLSKQADIAWASPEETELLQRLSAFVIWLGRYPAPTRLAGAKPQKLTIGLLNTLGTMRGSDARVAEQIINRLMNLYETSRAATF